MRLKKDTESLENFTCASEDGMCEFQVGREKLGRKFKNLESWKLFSEMTGVTWRCNHFSDYFYTHIQQSNKRKRRYRSAIKSSKNSRTIVYELLVRASCNKYIEGRNMDPNFLWGNIRKFKHRHKQSSSKNRQ